MDSIVDRVWTQAAFFDWAEAQEERYEFDGTWPVLMVGGTFKHNLIWCNLLVALRNRLKGGPCQALAQAASVETGGGRVRYPDVLVTCSPSEMGARTMPGVVTVFEVPSPSSERLDRLIKVEEYAAVPSIRRYVIVETAFAGLTMLSRASAHDPWTMTPVREGGVLALPELGIEVPVGEIYEGVAFD